jgi:hypothetical protein
MIDTPILQLCIELLMRNIEKISSLFRVVEPKQVRHRSHHEDLEGDRIVFSEFLMKDRKKPEKFLPPHGMPSDGCEFAFSSRVPPKALTIKIPYTSWNYQGIFCSLSPLLRLPSCSVFECANPDFPPHRFSKCSAVSRSSCR